MNPCWENGKSMSSRTHLLPKGEVTAHLLPKGEVTAVASNIICPRQGILESKTIYDGYEDVDTCPKLNARVLSSPIYQHKHMIKKRTDGRESTVERLRGGRSSSTPVISGRPPLQPHSRRRMSGGPSRVSVQESRTQLGVGKPPQGGRSASERLRQRDSKWNSSSRPVTDRPPSQPFICRKQSTVGSASTKESHEDPNLKKPRPESSVRNLQQSGDSRWSSGSRATFDIAPFHSRWSSGSRSMSPLQVLAGSSVRSLKQNDDSSWCSGYRSA
jgi:hypothetical protein